MCGAWVALMEGGHEIKTIASPSLSPSSNPWVPSRAKCTRVNSKDTAEIRSDLGAEASKKNNERKKRLSYVMLYDGILGFHKVPK